MEKISHIIFQISKNMFYDSFVFVLVRVSVIFRVSLIDVRSSLSATVYRCDKMEPVWLISFKKKIRHVVFVSRLSSFSEVAVAHFFGHKYLICLVHCLAAHQNETNKRKKKANYI